MRDPEKMSWRVTLVISILFGLGSILWTYKEGWTVLVKKPAYKEYTQEGLLKTLNDLEERIRLYRKQGPPKNKVEMYSGEKSYDYLKQQRILEALGKKPLSRPILIQEFVDEVSTLSVIFGYLLSFLLSFLCPWVAFYMAKDSFDRISNKGSGTEIKSG